MTKRLTVDVVRRAAEELRRTDIPACVPLEEFMLSSVFGKGELMDEHIRNEAAEGNLDPERNMQEPPAEGTPPQVEAPEMHLQYDSVRGETVMQARERYGQFMNEAEKYRQTLERMAGMDQTVPPHEV